MFFKNKNLAKVFSVLLFLVSHYTMAQECRLIGIELMRAPEAFKDAPAYNFGTKLKFFASDTLQVTGLSSKYRIKRWSTDTGTDLIGEHKKLTKVEVQRDYSSAKDTMILSNRDFWQENGKGFVFELHSWAIPESDAKTMTLEGGIGYTVLEEGDVLFEDITHLAGNFGFETMSLDFKGNTIDLKKVVYGRGEEAYSTFSGAINNKAYGFAIQKMEFLDNTGAVLDELFFGYANTYSGASTRNRVDLLKTSVLRIHYKKLTLKQIAIKETFGIGF